MHGFGGAPTGLGFPQEGLGHFLRQAKFAPHVTPYTLRVKGGESRGRVFLLPPPIRGRERKRLRSLRLQSPSPQESLTVGRLQIEASPALLDRSLDLFRLGQRRKQAPAPRRSRAFPASAKSLRARARGRRGLRQGGRSIGRAWRARAPRAVRSCACLAAVRPRWRSGAPPRRVAGLAGSRFSSISPRTRCSSASNVRWPIRSHVASASSRLATARSGSPARASASAKAILTSPSKSRTFCSRRSSIPRRMASSPPLAVLP